MSELVSEWHTLGFMINGSHDSCIAVTGIMISGRTKIEEVIF